MSAQATATAPIAESPGAVGTEKEKKVHTSNEEKKRLIHGIKRDIARIPREDYGYLVPWKQMNPNRARQVYKVANPMFSSAASAAATTSAAAATSSSSSSSSQPRFVHILVRVGSAIGSTAGEKYMRNFEDKDNSWKFPADSLRSWVLLLNSRAISITAAVVTGDITKGARKAISDGSEDKDDSDSGDDTVPGLGGAEGPALPSPAGPSPADSRLAEDEDSDIAAIIETFAGGSKTGRSSKKRSHNAIEGVENQTRPSKTRKLDTAEEEANDSDTVPFAARASDVSVPPTGSLHMQVSATTPVDDNQMVSPETPPATAAPGAARPGYAPEEAAIFIREAEAFLSDSFLEVAAIKKHVNDMLDSKLNQLNDFQLKLQNLKRSFGL